MLVYNNKHNIYIYLFLFEIHKATIFTALDVWL
jgi:hypothetical protein